MHRPWGGDGPLSSQSMHALRVVPASVFDDLWILDMKDTKARDSRC